MPKRDYWVVAIIVLKVIYGPSAKTSYNTLCRYVIRCGRSTLALIAQQPQSCEEDGGSPSIACETVIESSTLTYPLLGRGS